MRVVVSVVALALTFSSAAGAKEYVVKMKFDEDRGVVYFEPKRLEINRGDRVTWIQEDADNPHNVVSYPSGIPKSARLFKSPMLQRRGDMWTMRFDRPGTYEYHCHPHEAVGMKGMVIVERESRPDEMRQFNEGDHTHKISAGHSGPRSDGEQPAGDHHDGGHGDELDAY